MKNRLLFVFLTLALFASSVVSAADSKMVIQINSKDLLTQKMALNDAKNLKRVLGNDNVDVEIVVFGPGVRMLAKDAMYAERLNTLRDEYGVKFSACEGTLKLIERKQGEPLDLVDGVEVVPTGALRILELQQQGYAYMRP